MAPDAGKTEARLQAKVGSDDPLVAWAQGWVSYDGRLHAVLAARTLDFAVLTTGRLCLVTTGFFSRRPRRRVYDVALDRIAVDELEHGRRPVLRIVSRQHRPLRIELRRHERSAHFAQELVLHTRPPGTEPPATSEEP